MYSNSTNTSHIRVQCRQYSVKCQISFEHFTLQDQKNNTVDSFIKIKYNK